MTPAELKAVLQRLQDADPTSRMSRKRQLLSSAREPIIALHRRGYSWRSLARELSCATGESISADLLRAACLQRRQRRPGRRMQGASTKDTPQPTSTRTTVEAPIPKTAPKANSERFGAKGLKL